MINTKIYCLECKKSFYEGDLILNILPPQCPYCGSRKTIWGIWKSIGQFILKKIIDVSIFKDPA